VPFCRWPRLEQPALTSCTSGASKARMVRQGTGEGEASRDGAQVPGGAVPGLAGEPAFTLAGLAGAAIPVLVAVPHAGRCYSPSLLARMRQPDEVRLRLEDRLADLVGREVARQTGAALLVAHAPRALVDLNRAPDDMDWDMVTGGAPRGLTRLAAGRRARSGLGLVPRRLAGVGELWHSRITREELEARIELVHRPYHAALGEALETLRDRWGSALLVDLHSMPPLGPKSGPDGAADFVVGDRFGASCRAALSISAIRVLECAGRRALHNRPYAGGYVLERHSAPQRGIHALQLEMCRTAYLDQALREPGAGMEAVAALVSELVAALAARLDDGWDTLPQAAE
jgi:N-formylglutamate amidohydrolase